MHSAPSSMTIHEKVARLSESRREREFYRYYEPIRALTEVETAAAPPLCNLNDQAAVDAHRPISSPDRALTAFCQLGALRLGTRRAMLFFFDSQYAYVLAEATRTLSLVDNSVHEIEDALWLGHSIIPRGFSICEETVCRLPPDDDEEGYISDHSIIHVINDLDQDVQFCDRPFVQGGPKAKFYAGVPITTARGINIGAYCLLDDHKRDGLDAKGVAFLKDMSVTIMKHLESLRAQAEYQRSQQMVSGLGAFIEGATSLQGWEKESERNGRRRNPRRKPSTLQRPPLAPLPAEGSDQPSSQGTPSQTTSSDSVPSVDNTDVVTESTTPAESTQPPQKASTTRRADDLREHLIARNISATFQRAADLLRQATDVDGCAFLDSTPGTYGGLVETQDGSDQTSDSLISGTETTGTEGEATTTIPERDALCRVLASSHDPKDKFDHRGALRTDIQATNVTERFLRALLRRHPQGKIWNFNQEGEASSESELSDGSPPSNSPQVGASDSSLRRTARKRRNRIDDGREIQRLFPGVRSLALVGMWDQNRGRWFAACALWTYSPLRLFSVESEVHYVAAFCDVVMAEMKRLESQNSDRSKSDFISSISHELRSPLHGILGSVEVLQEQLADPISADLASQIEVCGRTLLDIVDHLLDFSKINYHARSRRTVGDRDEDSRSRRQITSNSQGNKLGNMMVLDADIALDEVTEEVVEAAVYSFCCSRGKQSILDRKVTITLEIDRSADISWHCKLPLGGWKRICINLVSNALKYTPEGFIRVSLRAEPIAGKRKKFNAVFQVIDSGRGMSREFLENHLFRAFSQEDALVEGTGLGMSLVAKIIRAMGGKIEVQSEKDHGTVMTVTVPVDQTRISKDERTLSAQRAARVPLNGTSIGLIVPNSPSHGEEAAKRSVQELAHFLLLESVKRNCTQLGLELLQEVSPSALPQAKVLMITEEDMLEHLGLHNAQMPVAVDKPLILLCNSAISARQIRSEGTVRRITKGSVEYVAQPCASGRLSKAVYDCLTGRSSGESFSTDNKRREPVTGALDDTDLRQSERKSDFDYTQGLSAENPHKAGDDIATEGALYTPSVSPLPTGHDSGTTDKPTVPAIEPLSVPRQDDYLSVRSRSAGDQPLSPSALDERVSPGESTIKQRVKSAPFSGLSLMLVDDNSINLQLLVNYASKQGHHKIVARTGQEAVDVYKSAASVYTTVNTSTDPQNPSSSSAKHSVDLAAPPPDEKPQVILMDINMPVLNGFEATRQIRAFEQAQGLQPAYIIALTGLGSASAQQEAFSSGVDLFLTKPVKLKELTKILAEVMKMNNEKEKGKGGMGK